MLLDEEETGDSPESWRKSTPSKVTRAFSALHERFAELKRPRMMSEERGMEKFVLAAEMRRGMASPRVTFV